MKVKELIALLQSQDQEKDVAIQQGEDFDFTMVYSVKEQEVFFEETESDEKRIVVTINYV